MELVGNYIYLVGNSKNDNIKKENGKEKRLLDRRADYGGTL